MKGKISLQDFITDVKNELITSFLNDPSGLFKISDVQLEVNFGVQIEAGVGFKCFVFDASSKSAALQSHKVSITLTPLIDKGLIEQKTAGKKSASGVWVSQDTPVRPRRRAAPSKKEPVSGAAASHAEPPSAATSRKKTTSKKPKTDKP
jgi:hypothetical protein